jgi:hypothetical protein
MRVIRVRQTRDNNTVLLVSTFGDLWWCCVVFVRAFSSVHPSPSLARCMCASIWLRCLRPLVRVFLVVSLLATGVARVAGGGLLYHGAKNLGAARGDDPDVYDLLMMRASHECPSSLLRPKPRCRGGLA